MACVTRHRHTGTAAALSPKLDASRCGGEGKGEEEADMRGPGVQAHFNQVILYTNTASIKASLDTNKNIILGPARTTDTQLVLNLYRPTP